ncbi:MAG: hypothetical protein ACFB9N_12675 [Geitlerinemataceae cyanobacterium]
MAALDWQQSLRQRLQDDDEEAKFYLEAVLEDADADGYTEAIAPAAEDVAIACGHERALKIVRGLEAGRAQHRAIMLDALSAATPLDSSTP